MNKDKISKAIEAFKTAEKIARDFYDKPVVVTYSGGKDSDVLLDLAIKSGINFEVSHSITTVDAPQTNRHVNKVFAELKEKGIKAYKNMPIYKGKPINMFSLIAQKGMPPTRLVRYCCGVFKEGTERNRVVALGVRSAESIKRRNRDTFSTVGKKLADSKHFSLEHTEEVFKDAKEQDEVWDCMLVTTARKHKTILVNPIYDWTDAEIWEYIHENNIAYNELYDMGYSRVGCILCPLANKREKQRDILIFPAYKERYIKAFGKMLKTRKAAGKDDPYGEWTDGEGVFRWWIEDKTIKGQMEFDFSEKE
ncbi:phosphoadenosine phosphosulfate reductase family protein [Lachnoanaerobaculum saburreum F0468]|uniref:Phosphoadenosine phosphosulfate reductase family protein n=1 Tax=Lachnoanaerobaculum saburreum F0468 TaxID=1095750 RepID=I0R729_9FIRM|nr:phosphoadenosine phosphosulfate reductase family protein [Lachnoanaerobaculum saburreum]EIC95487.1 phosphoadenosine phosphosulfate reductase family protein [Lachnoanaerobaculum saburreum F0468]